MNLFEAQKMLMEIMSKYNLTKSTGWDCYIRSMGIHKFGRCTAKRMLDRETMKMKVYGGFVEINRNFVLINDTNEVRITMIHEIAHARDFLNRGFSGHDTPWKKLVIEMGGNVNRYWNANDRNVLQPAGKWTGKCPQCGREIHIARKPKRNRSCGKCFPYAYNEKYKIIFQLNSKR